MDNSKACTKCGQIKPFDSFSRHNGKKASKSGRRATCKTCDVESARIYRANNREKVRASKKKWAQENKQSKALSDQKYREANKESVKIRNAQWRLENTDILKEKSKAYRLKHKNEKNQKDAAYAKANPEVNRRASAKYRMNNPEKAKLSAKKWRQNNPEFGRAKSQKRRRRLESDNYLITKKEMRNLYKQPCLYCGAPSEHIDHIVPLSRGGKHSIGNLTGACASCNLSKGSKFITEWKKGKNGH